MSTEALDPACSTLHNAASPRMLRWKNYHAGEECLLICNGPSLNRVDWSRVPEHLTKFGLNKIYLGAARFGFLPRYLCCVNEKVLRQSAEEWNQLSAVKFVSNRLGEDWYPETPLQYRLNTQQMPSEAEQFSPDPCQYVVEGWTVTYVALQIIYYMGFQRVGIVGMDHRYAQAVFGEENLSSTIVGDDHDHFDPRYFRGQQWDQPDLANSENAYRVAREMYERAGRALVDYTIEGTCTVFERRSIDELYHSQAVGKTVGLGCPGVCEGTWVAR